MKVSKAQRKYEEDFDNRDWPKKEIIEHKSFMFVRMKNLRNAWYRT